MGRLDTLRKPLQAASKDAVKHQAPRGVIASLDAALKLLDFVEGTRFANEPRARELAKGAIVRYERWAKRVGRPSVRKKPKPAAPRAPEGTEPPAATAPLALPPDDEPLAADIRVEIPPEPTSAAPTEPKKRRARTPRIVLASEGPTDSR